MTILYILFWLIGWIITYMILSRMEEFPHSWNNDKRGIAAFFSFFSWIAILVMIFLVIITLIGMGIGWLLNKFVVPILKKLEPKIKEDKE